MRKRTERKQAGDRHEHRVIQALHNHGWTVQPCGRSTCPAPVQDALRRIRAAPHPLRAASAPRRTAPHPHRTASAPRRTASAPHRIRSALRPFPDLIAARGADLVTIDAKDRMPSTHSDRYAISTATLNAGLLFTAAHAPTPLYYVFGDLKSSRPPKSSTTATMPCAVQAAPTTSSAPTAPAPSAASSAQPPPRLPDQEGPGAARAGQ
ncbi:hypothetical protein [Streptomyces sp. NPDC018059]|uniref:hypothetical protein n=1 Tax=Streptomyces sp. NPDC018059 TaxID=3365041 RepID=UPI0037B40EC1